ncbi:MAG TPA: hypothetical protein VHZ25_00610 [Acidobacteriaceae bacterium]|jgi:hypothetical protein|nr:hypothetical protein [Acidobacteriaceae bacterium]
MDPELSSRAVTHVFPHSWKAEILPERPLIQPSRCYTYPREAEEVERGALEVMVHPAANAVRFLATFALGFKDPAVPTGLWSCPATDDLCAVAGGYAYIVNTVAPGEFTHIALRPALEIRSLPKQRLLIFVGHHTLLAWGASGEAWRTPPLSAEGLRLTEIQGDNLHGFGWDLSSDREIPFTVDLSAGRCSGA